MIQFAMCVIFGYTKNAIISEEKKKLKKTTEGPLTWYCKKCIKEVILFSGLTDMELLNGKIIVQKKIIKNNDSCYDSRI